MERWEQQSQTSRRGASSVGRFLLPLVAIAGSIFIFAKIKAAQDSGDSLLDRSQIRSFGTSDLALRNAIFKDDANRVKQLLGVVPKNAVHRDFIDNLAFWPTANSLDAALSAGYDPSGGQHDNGPLFTAVSRGDVKVVEVLLRHGVDPNCKSPDGEPVLFEAVRSSAHKGIISGEVAQFLLDHGAKPEIQGIARPVLQRVVGTRADQYSAPPLPQKGGTTTQSSEKLTGAILFPGVVVVPIGPPKSPTNALFVAVGSSNIGAIRVLLDHRVDPNWVPEGGIPAIVLAASFRTLVFHTLPANKSGSSRMISLLLEHGATVNSTGTV